jgi:hypothetical protein
VATLDIQVISLSGLEPAYDPAAGGGDKVRPGEHVFLHVKNADDASHTVTIVTPGTVKGQAIADLAVAVPAGEDRMIPVPADLFRNPVDGLASITYDAVTDVTVAAIQA